MGSPKDQALLELAESDLPATIIRTAVRLLTLANDAGQVRISKAEMMTIIGTESDGTVRSHLSKLSGAGVIHYSTNARVYVDFLAFCDSRPRAQRANHDAERSNCNAERAEIGDSTDDESDARALSARITTLSDQIATPSARNARIEPALGSYWLVGSSFLLPDPLSDQEPTNHVQPTDAEIERSLRLLIDPELIEGVHQPQLHAAKASVYAMQHQFAWLFQQVGAYWRDLQQGKVRGIGALHKRIEAGFRLDPWDKDFLASEFYRRHYPLTRAQLRQRDYDPNPPPLERWIAELPEPIWEEAEP